MSAHRRRACSPASLTLRTSHPPQSGRPTRLRHAAGCRSHRRGYTLLELMLVLGILLVLAGIVWPGIQGMYERHRLQSAAEDVRALLAGARLRAIDSSLVYQFVYEPGGTTFSVLPFETATAAIPTTTVLLPDPLKFEAIEVPANSTTSILRNSTTPLSGQSSRSIPVLFTPDGSAIDSTLTIADDDGRTIRLSVRGLTGAVTIGNVQQRATR